jgi:hypothetical protein
MPKAKKKKFTQGGRSRNNTTDAKGSVRIQVILLNERGTHATKGNITKTIRIEGAKVSDVHATLLNHLF